MALIFTLFMSPSGPIKKIKAKKITHLFFLPHTIQAEKIDPFIHDHTSNLKPDPVDASCDTYLTFLAKDFLVEYVQCV